MQTANKPENTNKSHEAHPSLGKARKATRTEHWQQFERWSILLQGAAQQATKAAAELADRPSWCENNKEREKLNAIIDDMTRYFGWMKDASYRIETTDSE